jgi:short-subunit dehydrogenase
LCRSRLFAAIDGCISEAMTRAASGSEEPMSTNTRPLVLVTGASTGIGYELARCCAANGFDLLIVADEPAIEDAAGSLRQTGVKVEAVQADLATLRGVDRRVHAGHLSGRL